MKKTETETQIQSGIVTMLRLRYRIIAHQSKGREMAQGMSSAMWDRGGTRGVSDLAATLPGGRALWIEVKKPGGRFEPGQKEFLTYQRSQGAVAFVAYSVDDVIRELEAQGVKR